MVSRAEPDLLDMVFMDRPRIRDLFKVCQPWCGWVNNFSTKPLPCWLWRAQYSPIWSGATSKSLYMMSRAEPDLSGKVIVDRPQSRDLFKVCNPWIGWVANFGTKPLPCWLWRAQYSPIRSRGTSKSLYMMSRAEPDLSGKVIMDRPQSRDLFKVCHPLV